MMALTFRFFFPPLGSSFSSLTSQLFISNNRQKLSERNIFLKTAQTRRSNHEWHEKGRFKLMQMVKNEEVARKTEKLV